MPEVDMSPEEITRRLEQVSSLRDLRVRRRGRPDMSAAAVDLRLRRVSRLLELCRALQPRAGSVEDAGRRPARGK
jgi:hypothetical protein